MKWLQDLIALFTRGRQPESAQAQYQPPATPTPTARPTPVPNEYESRTMPTFDQYEIPREVAYGIANAEGGRIGNNNLFNIGAYDKNPGAAVDYNSLEAAATAAAKLLSGQFKRTDGSIDTNYSEAYGQRSNPEEMLRLIMLAGFAGDPKTWKKRSADTGGAGKTFNSWDEFVKATPSWKKWHDNY